MSDANTLFITATRSKFLFASSAGQLTVQDLWDLPLTGRGANLDDVARALHKSLREDDGDVSFVKTVVKKAAETQMKFDLVKYVIDVKVAERDARKTAEEKADTKQKLMAKLAEKKDKALDEMSEQQIQTMIDSL